MASRLTLSNRRENLNVLKAFLRTWGRQRGLASGKIKSLEEAAAEIFQFILTRVYPPGLPGSISIELEEKGVRLRMVFEDDGPPYDAAAMEALCPPTGGSSAGLNLPQHTEWIDSVVYYRTADQKNRLVTFYSL
jgi:anti-sigma regulatory factor (Ser/Thr protein kinase)|uniref:ATP-binding protein n=1 Tax=Desulfobacca acetoxidans TaxID=60893 RepID=A0A7C3UZ87_9BACT